MERKLTAILYADVAGYSRLTGADDEGTVETLKVHLGALINAIEDHGGRVVNTAGDAVLAEFASVVTALKCAVEAQRDLAERNRDLPEYRKLQFRVGVNLGDLVVDGDEIYGDGVNVAARLEALATPGGICISGRVEEQVEGKLDVGFAYLGAQSVKNIKKPVNVYKVLLDRKDAGKIIGAPRPQASGWGWVTAATLALVIGLGGWATWLHMNKPDVTPASLDKMAFPLPDKPSIAVLPFDNLSGDPEQEYLADGMTETIIAALAQIPELFVIARNSTFTYKGKPVLVRDVARDMGVRYVLEGSIQRVGDQLRITAQLIDALEDRHLWAKTYDRTTSNFFGIQDEIALETAIALEVEIIGEQGRLWSGTTDNLEAWSVFKKGRADYEKYSRDGNPRARDLAYQAVAIDPEFVEAWNLIGWTHATDARLGYSESRGTSLEMAMEMADKVESLAPQSPQSHQLRSFVYMLRGDFEPALKEGNRAVELIPSGAVHRATLGMIYYFTGRYDVAVRVFRESMRLNPAYPSWYVLYLSQAYTELGEYDKAIEVARQGLARAEGSFMAASHHIREALAFERMGDMDQARKNVTEALRLAPFLSLKFYRKLMHYQNPADWDRFAEALRKSGLPN